MENSNTNRFFYGILGLSAVWLVALVTNIWPYLRGGFGWRWNYDGVNTFSKIILLSCVIVVYLAGSYFLKTRRHIRLLLLWSLIGGIAISFAVTNTHQSNVRDFYVLGTLDSGATGWHYASTQYQEQGARDTLTSWPDQMHSYEGISAHVAISPPGLVIAHAQINELMSLSDLLSADLADTIRPKICDVPRYQTMSDEQIAGSWIGLFTPFITALAVIPLFFLAKRYGSEMISVWSVIWWPLVPATSLFQPYPSVIYPTLMLFMMWALIVGLKNNRLSFLFLAGLIMSLASFMNFSMIPVLFLVGFIALGVYFQDRTQENYSWIWPFKMGIVYGCGLIFVWFIYYIIYGVSFFEVLDTTLHAHLDLDRPYFPWLVLHIYDFAMFLGLPIFLLAGWFTLKQGQQLWKMKTFTSNVQVLAMALFLTFVLLDLSGTARGETGRVWLFFMPYLLILAGTVIENSFKQRTGWFITIAQSVVLVGLASVISPIGVSLGNPPATPSWNNDPITAYLPNGAIYGNAIELQSFSGYIDTAEEEYLDSAHTLKIWVNWRAFNDVENEYYVSLLPVDPSGNTQEPYLEPPFENNTYLPTTCWLPERGIITDYYEVPIKVDGTGDWWVSVQFFTREGETLAVKTPDGMQDNQVGIGPFNLQ